MTLLREVARLVADGGWTVGNVAVQVIANEPRSAPRRDEAEHVAGAVVGRSGVGRRPPRATGWASPAVARVGPRSRPPS